MAERAIGRPKLVQHVIEADVDDHVFIMVKRPGRPTVSLDLANSHGRAGISVRTDGHGIASIMTDVDWKEPKSGDVFARFCPMCGEKLNHVLSSGHHCKDGDID